MRVASIVEGHGEVEALPVLFRRLVSAWSIAGPVEFPTPIRVKRDRFLNQPREFDRCVELAALKASHDGRVMILLDADDDCPATLGPRLLERARAVHRDIPFSVVLANREFEAWFIAAGASLSPNPKSAVLPEAETVRGAKEWVGTNLLRCPYAETLHQPSLSARMDLQAALAAPSFAKFCRDLRRLLPE